MNSTVEKRRVWVYGDGILKYGKGTQQAQGSTFSARKGSR